MPNIIIYHWLTPCGPVQYGGVALHLCTVQGEPSSTHLGRGKIYLDNKVCDKYAADMQKTSESPGTSHGIYLILSFPKVQNVLGIKLNWMYRNKKFL